MQDVIAMILGGGRGTRLFPLTLHRSKPAVPIAGKYRLIDIPISNCLNSNCRRIFVLTQYQSESLNKHLNHTYKFDYFSSGFVALLAAEQTEEHSDWFQGTADAVRRSLRHLAEHRFREALILSGDQLYQMDYRKMLDTHRRHVADVTVAVTPVTAEQAPALGILKVNRQGRITHFEEKPKPERLPELVSEMAGAGPPSYLASMGIYVFNREALERSLGDATLNDFGKNVIPEAVPRLRVHAHVQRGYWEDVGTIKSYFLANLALCQPVPPFDFYDAARPVYTNPRLLPATKVESCSVKNALVSEGCILVGAEVERAVLGIRSRIARGARIRESLVLGADFYETLDEIQRQAGRATPPIGIGSDTVVERAIIDKNARIGAGVSILNEAGVQEADGDGYFIREGIVIVPKNGVIKDGTVI
ncbi:MAG TPA: glucose-1-phosphate adenylyltransferase [Vicinamibacteria bacterium]|nr:glucose-1-phosphate adenylyltransferase [Vicinamibacteria bacterium]